MEIAVIRELSTADLQERLAEQREQLVKLKLAHAVSPLDNPNKIKQQKVTIARILTELRKREIA